MTAITIQIRELSSNDSIEELTDLITRAYAPYIEKGIYVTAANQTPAETIQRILGAACYVATLGARLIGTVAVRPNFKHSLCEYFTRPEVAYCYQFAVDPELQGHGIGFRLLMQAEAWAKENGFSELAGDRAEGAPEHLRGLHQKFGFLEIDLLQWPDLNYRSVILSKEFCDSPRQG